MASNTTNLQVLRPLTGLPALARLIPTERSRITDLLECSLQQLIQTPFHGTSQEQLMAIEMLAELRSELVDVDHQNLIEACEQLFWNWVRGLPDLLFPGGSFYERLCAVKTLHFLQDTMICQDIESKEQLRHILRQVLVKIGHAAQDTLSGSLNDNLAILRVLLPLAANIPDHYTRMVRLTIHIPRYVNAVNFQIEQTILESIEDQEETLHALVDLQAALPRDGPSKIVNYQIRIGRRINNLSRPPVVPNAQAPQTPPTTAPASDYPPGPSNYHRTPAATASTPQETDELEELSEKNQTEESEEPAPKSTRKKTASQGATAKPAARAKGKGKGKQVDDEAGKGQLEKKPKAASRAKGKRKAAESEADGIEEPQQKRQKQTLTRATFNIPQSSQQPVLETPAPHNPYGVPAPVRISRSEQQTEASATADEGDIHLQKQLQTAIAMSLGLEEMEGEVAAAEVEGWTEGDDNDDDYEEGEAELAEDFDHYD